MSTNSKKTALCEENPILYKALEKIIFNEREFEDLKEIINRLSAGGSNLQQLKKKIINSRIRILEDVSDFITFHLKQQNISFKDDKSVELKRERNEKDNFLTLLAKKIENIYQNLKSD